MADGETIELSPELAAVVRDHPLPEGIDDLAMNVSEIALALNVSANTVTKWVARAVPASEWQALPSFPVIEMGGPGKPYEIQLGHAYAWRQHQKGVEEERSSSAARAIARMQATFLNIEGEADGPVMTAKMRREMAEADVVWSKAQMLRRRLVDVTEVQAVWAAVFQIVRNGMESMPDRLERELGLKPDQVDLVVRLADDILREMADRIEEAQLRERAVDDDDDVPEQLLI